MLRASWLPAVSWAVLMAATSGGIGHADELSSLQSEDVPPLSDLLTESQDLAKEGNYADALRCLITALESYGDDAWNPEQYDRAMSRVKWWFAQVSVPQRDRFLSEYDADVPEGGRSAVPVLGGTMDWLRQLVPRTSLESPGSRLVLGICHSMTGHHVQFVAYAMGALQQAPESLAADQVIWELSFLQRYRFDREGLMRTVRVCSRIAPHSRATGWSVCQYLIELYAYGRRQEAEAISREIQAIAPNTLAGEVASQVDALVRDIQGQEYESAIARTWDIREYAFYGPLRPVLNTLCLGISWYTASSSGVPPRGQRLMQAAEGVAERNKGTQLGSFALCILGHCYQAMSDGRRCGALFLEAAEGGHPEVVEHVLGNATRELASYDRKGAIKAAEWLLDMDDDGGYGWEPILRLLAKLYRQEGRYEDGLGMYVELENRCRAGNVLIKLDIDALWGGIAACLVGMGRDAEAEALSEPLLARNGYDSPPDSLSEKQLIRLIFLLEEMGREEESSQFRELFSRRLREARSP